MSETIKLQGASRKPRRRGFTLIEILVVVGIIVLLISITIPVISKVRKSANVASIQAQINSIEGAIRQYEQDYRSAPGPLAYYQVQQRSAPSGTDDIRLTGGGPSLNAKITMAENLVLGLLGGLKLNTSSSTATVEFDPAMVGAGPRSLNVGKQTTGRAYLEKINLSEGDYKDGSGDADDTVIPEILDTWPTPMPILYLRARKGVAAQVAPFSPQSNNVITYDTNASDARLGQYDLSQIIGYTAGVGGNSYIGEGKSIAASEYTGGPTPFAHGLAIPDPGMDISNPPQSPFTKYEYPYNSFAYFKNPASPGNNPEARNKDGFILISAGADRVYGTSDDITNFGSVNP